MVHCILFRHIFFFHSVCSLQIQLIYFNNQHVTDVAVIVWTLDSQYFPIIWLKTLIYPISFVLFIYSLILMQWHFCFSTIVGKRVWRWDWPERDPVSNSGLFIIAHINILTQFCVKMKICYRRHSEWVQPMDSTI